MLIKGLNSARTVGLPSTAIRCTATATRACQGKDSLLLKKLQAWHDYPPRPAQLGICDQITLRGYLWLDLLDLLEPLSIRNLEHSFLEKKPSSQAVHRAWDMASPSTVLLSLHSALPPPCAGVVFPEPRLPSLHLKKTFLLST